MSTLPSPVPYRRHKIQRLCRKLLQAELSIMLPGERVAIHDIHPNVIPAGRSIPEHTHSFYEAHLVLDGHAQLTLPRLQPVLTGGTFLLPPHSPHAWQTGEESMSSIVIWFLVEGAYPALPLPLYHVHQPSLLWTVRLMLDELQEEKSGWRERASSYLSVIVSRILALTQQPEQAAFATDMETPLETIIDQFLWDNLPRVLTVAEIAAHVGMSERNLFRRFRQLTGQTLTQRLSILRVQRAQTLLEESDAPLGEIAQQVGIADPPYLCRCFKRQTGMTPHQYRISMRG